ncbi:MAG TPA: YbfB/YjiJ family MFS transporter [Beijerinckiaceae bacterium]|jgi:predicted MFS family arabinose efflux permease
MRGTLSALCAILVGIGLARFAYTPLIPALVEAGWFSPAGAAYLGAANLAGYLAGALAGRAMAARIPVPALMRGMMLLASLSFLACAGPLPFAWFFLWRFVSGFTGAVLMVVAAPAVLPQVPAERRGLAGGAIFTAVGLGIAASGTLVPLLLGIGLPQTWIGLGALSLVLTLLAWSGWPRARTMQAATSRASSRPDPRLKALYLEYAFDAAGSVPHMVFLVDFIARDLGRGVTVGAWHWVLFGAGATAGPVLAGFLGDRIGFGPALRLAFVVKALCVGSLAVADGPVALALTSIVVGAFLPGNVALILGRVRELARDEPEARTGWTFATLAYAIGQAAAAYGLSFLFARTGSYALLFEVAAGALAAALVIDFLAARPRAASG